MPRGLPGATRAGAQLMAVGAGVGAGLFSRHVPWNPCSQVTWEVLRRRFPGPHPRSAESGTLRDASLEYASSTNIPGDAFVFIEIKHNMVYKLPL